MGDIRHRPATKQWRLNASLLNDKECITFVTSELSDYLDINTSPEISPLTLWDGAEPFITGRTISFGSAK